MIDFSKETMHNLETISNPQGVNQTHGIGNIMEGLFFEPSTWVFIATLIVIIVFFSKKVHKLILSTLDDHRQQISKDLEKTKLLREEAQNMLVSYKRELENIKSHADEIIKNAHESALIIKEKNLSEIDVIIKRKEQASKDRLKFEIAEFKQQLKITLADEVHALTLQEINKKISNDKYQQILDESLSQLEKTNIKIN